MGSYQNDNQILHEFQMDITGKAQINSQSTLYTINKDMYRHFWKITHFNIRCDTSSPDMIFRTYANMTLYYHFSEWIGRVTNPWLNGERWLVDFSLPKSHNVMVASDWLILEGQISCWNKMADSYISHFKFILESYPFHFNIAFTVPAKVIFLSTDDGFLLGPPVIKVGNVHSHLLENVIYLN